MAARGLRLERTLGPAVVGWIEQNLVHGPGDVQGQPVELDDEQTKFIFKAYAIDDHGRRVVRRACYSRPKGRAKTELAAMIACAEAIGPVRFNGWGHDGRPEGGRCAPRSCAWRRPRRDRRGTRTKRFGVMLTEGPLAALGLDVGLTRTISPVAGRSSR